MNVENADRKGNVPEKLESINSTLVKQNEIIQKMLDIMPRPPGKFTSILTTVLIFVGILGIVSFIDVIIKWFTGG